LHIISISIKIRLSIRIYNNFGEIIFMSDIKKKGKAGWGAIKGIGHSLKKGWLKREKVEEIDNEKEVEE
jgi:hypothetical protein